MKMVLAIVSSDDTVAVNNNLTMHGFMVTQLSTTGGFLKAGNTTFLIGVNDEKVDEVIELIKEKSQRRTEVVPQSALYEMQQFISYPTNVQVGGATIFVLDVDKFIKA